MIGRFGSKMALRNALEQVATESTLAAAKIDLDGILARLPAALDTDGGLKVHVQNQAVFSGDVTDRAARLLGHVTVDSLPDVTLANPFSGDVTDRAARLLGHVTVDSLPNVTVSNPTDVSALATQATLASVDTRLAGTLAVNSELPAAAALSDADANPTVPGVGSYGMLWNGSTQWRRMSSPPGMGDTNALGGAISAGTWFYNGSTWDRVRGTIANGLLVDVSRVQGTVGVDTELPAAAALGDADANATAPMVGADNMLWTGAAWRRQGSLPAVASDAVAGGQIAAIGPWVYNGTNWDRVRSVPTTAATFTPTGTLSTGLSIYDGSGLYFPVVSLSQTTDALVGRGALGVGNLLYNGTNWDRARSSTVWSPVTNPVGFAASVSYLYNSASIVNPLIAVAAAADVHAGTGILAGGHYVYNGSTWDRTRSALGANVGTLSQAGDSLVVSGTGAATDATPIASTDVRAYRSATVQITGTFTATYTFEVSNDNTNWQALPAEGVQAVVGDGTTSAWTTPAIWVVPIHARYFRVRVNPYTSGTVSATALFVAEPTQLPVTQVNTELANPIAPADGLTTSAPLVQGYNYVYNGTTWDRLRAATATAGTTGTGLLGVAMQVKGTTNYNDVPSVASIADAVGNGIPAFGSVVYNGTNWDRIRSATAASATTGTGLLGAGLLIFDGTNYKQVVTASAQGDAVAGTSLVANALSIYNGTTFDRLRSANSGAGTTGTGLLGAGVLGFDGTNYQRVLTDTAGRVLVTANGSGVFIGDGAAAGGSLQTTVGVYNGTNYDRLRSATSASATTGTGLLGVGALGFDGTNYQRLSTDTSGRLNAFATMANANAIQAASTQGDGVAGASITTVGNHIFNGTTFDRMRVANSAAATTGTGLLGVGALGFDGTNYQRLSTDTTGKLNAFAVLGNANAISAASSVGDASAGTTLSNAQMWANNGTTHDKWKNNQDGTALASAARTTTTNSSSITNYNASALAIFLNVTVASGTGGLTVRVQGIDPVSGSVIALNAAPTAVTAIGTTLYVIGLGASGGGAAQATSAPVPRTWRVAVTHGDASSYTYSVGYSLIV